jgi:hypothetical protein
MKHKLQVLYLVSLREQHNLFLSLSCTDLVPTPFSKTHVDLLRRTGYARGDLRKHLVAKV